MKTNLSADMVKKICERLVQTDGDISTVATEIGVHTTLVRRIVEKKYMRQISDEYFKPNSFTKKEKENDETNVDSFRIPENIPLSSVVDVKSTMVIEPVEEENNEESDETTLEKEKRNYNLKHDFRVNYVAICTDILNSVPVDELSAKWDISIDTLNHIIDGTAYRYYTKKFWNYDKEGNIVPLQAIEYCVKSPSEPPVDPFEVIRNKIHDAIMNLTVEQLPEEIQKTVLSKLDETLMKLPFGEIKEMVDRYESEKE